MLGSFIRTRSYSKRSRRLETLRSSDPGPGEWLRQLCRELSSVASYHGSWGADYDQAWVSLSIEGDIRRSVLSWEATAPCQVSERLQGRFSGDSWEVPTKVLCTGRMFVAARSTHWEPPDHSVGKPPSFSARGLYRQGFIAWTSPHDYIGLRRICDGLRRTPEAFQPVFEGKPFLTVRLHDS